MKNHNKNNYAIIGKCLSYPFSTYNRKHLILLLLVCALICYWNLIPLQVPQEYISPTTLQQSKLQHCNCARNVPNTNGQDILNISYEETTCSREAYQRGSGQKVVAYSYYGDVTSDTNRVKYFEGIRANLALMPKIYPGWTMRVYMELEEGNPALDELCVLACADPILDLCHAGALPGTPMVDIRKMFPMIWRFLPTMDPQVDIYNCRDLDSRIGERELAAVEEWIRIGEPVHSMRDHPAHGTAMLGASWGADLRRKDSREKWKRSWEGILKDGNCWKTKEQGSGGPDQIVLQHHVWSWAREESVQHDSYLCQMYPGSIPWPVERKKEPNNFVASRVKANSTLWEVCPAQCRPKEHPEWEHC